MLALLAAVTMGQATQSNTAIFCLLGKWDASRNEIVSAAPVPLNVLLSGHPEDQAGRSILKTYDPAKLLKGASFDLLSLSTSSEPQGYALQSDGLSAKSGYLLMMTSAGVGKYTAAFGAKADKKAQRFVGQCFGPVGPLDEATFDAESRK